MWLKPKLRIIYSFLCGLWRPRTKIPSAKVINFQFLTKKKESFNKRILFQTKEETLCKLREKKKKEFEKIRVLFLYQCECHVRFEWFLDVCDLIWIAIMQYCYVYCYWIETKRKEKNENCLIDLFHEATAKEKKVICDFVVCNCWLLYLT